MSNTDIHISAANPHEHVSLASTMPSGETADASQKDGVAIAPVAAAEKDKEQAAPVVQERKPVKLFGMKLPDPLANVAYTFQGWGKKWRENSIKALPSFIVNNSPNVIGAMQLSAELAMFKSNGSDLVSPENARKPLHYLIDPPKNVWRSVTGRAGFQIKAKDLTDPGFYRKSLLNVTDVKAATVEDLAIGPLINRWQARATFAGLVGWGLNFITPNAKESPEEVEKLVKLQAEHPVKYIGECFRRGAVFPFLTVAQLAKKAVGSTSTDGNEQTNNEQIGSYKRYFSGLGMLIAGTCSFLGGWRNVSRSGGIERYYFNWQYCATGLITAMSSLPLLFSVDNDRGYSRFGAIHLARCFFLPGSIWKKYKSEDKGVSWYIGGHAMLQSKNLFAASAGGAKKIEHDDGTVEILDHTQEITHAKQEIREAREEKKHAKLEAKIAKADEEKAALESEKKDIEKKKDAGADVAPKEAVVEEKTPAPATKVAHTQAVEKAMPHRTAEMQEAVAV